MNKYVYIYIYIYFYLLIATPNSSKMLHITIYHHNQFKCIANWTRSYLQINLIYFLIASRVIVVRAYFSRFSAKKRMIFRLFILSLLNLQLKEQHGFYNRLKVSVEKMFNMNHKVALAINKIGREKKRCLFKKWTQDVTWKKHVYFERVEVGKVMIEFGYNFLKKYSTKCRFFGLIRIKLRLRATPVLSRLTQSIYWRRCLQKTPLI